MDKQKQDDAPNASAIRDYLTRLVSYPLVQFYRIEAKMWRELYQKQRGGKAYNEMQRELVETKRKLLSANTEVRDASAEKVKKKTLQTHSGLLR